MGFMANVTRMKKNLDINKVDWLLLSPVSDDTIVYGVLLRVFHSVDGVWVSSTLQQYWRLWKKKVVLQCSGPDLTNMNLSKKFREIHTLWVI